MAEVPAEQNFNPQWRNSIQEKLQGIRRSLEERLPFNAAAAIAPLIENAVRDLYRTFRLVLAENDATFSANYVRVESERTSGKKYVKFDRWTLGEIIGVIEGTDFLAALERRQHTPLLELRTIPWDLLNKIRNEPIHQADITPELAELLWTHLRILLKALDIIGIGLSSPPPTVLPRRPESLIGRSTAVLELASLVQAHSLVTLTGTGGVGKTSLVTELGYYLKDSATERFPDGLFFIELAPLPEASTTTEIELQIQDVITMSVWETRKERRLLLLLDNGEHLLAHKNTILQHVIAGLRDCSGIVVVLTSRTPTLLDGEKRFEVDVLSPEAAMQLFRERATEVNPTFSATEDELGELCNRLDYLPLALQIVAARMRDWTVTRALASSRLAVAVRNPLHPGRQKTLRTTIAWSYDLLEDDEKAVFMAMSVWNASFDIKDAETIYLGPLTKDVVIDDVLTTLRDTSLLSGVNGEFMMLSMIREFARNQLEAQEQAAGAIRRQHTQYVLEQADIARDKLHTPEEPTALAHLRKRRLDLEAARLWCESSGETELAGQICRNLGMEHELQGRMKAAVADYTRGAQLSHLPPKLRLWLLRSEVFARLETQQSPELIRELFASVVAETSEGDLEAQAELIELQGRFALAQRDFVTALSYYQQALLAFETLKRRRRVADIWISLAAIALQRREGDDLPKAKALLEAALTFQESEGSRRECGKIRRNMGIVAYYEGDKSEAEHHYRASLEDEAESGDLRVVAWALNDLGEVLLEQSRSDEATRALAAADRLFSALSEETGVKYVKDLCCYVDLHTFTVLRTEAQSLSIEKVSIWARTTS